MSQTTLDIPTARVFVPLLQPRRYKGARGGRGSGKSHFFAELTAEESFTQHIRCACLREFQNSIKESVKQLIEDKLQSLGIKHHYRITDTEISGPNDSLFIFKGAKGGANSLRSLEGFNRAVFEEAQAASQSTLDTLTPTMRTEDAEMRFAWNPMSPKDAVEKFFNENKDDPDYVCVTANYWDNPWFPDSLRRDMERDRKRNFERYQHIWCGKYQKSSQARVFTNVTSTAFETPANAMFYFGGDWGFSVDPSVLIRMFIVGKTIFIDHECYEVGVPIDELPFFFGGCENADLISKNKEAFAKLSFEKKRRWRGISGATQWQIRADNARPETIDYMKRHGFPLMVPSTKGAGSIKEGVDFLQSYDIVIHPRCVRTIEEFASFSYQIDKKTNEVTPILQDEKNHVIDSARYALELVRHNSTASSKPLGI